MTFYITDLMSLQDLSREISDGYVDVKDHPYLPLSIYNYTPKAMDGNWNEVTEHCRGLIVEQGTGLIVARGPRKFYNVGQKEAPVPTRYNDVTVTRKFDGSLGVCYVYDGNYGVATRGSFNSEQAIHATKLLQTEDYSWLRREIGYGDGISTSIVEIIYPDNRIVVDYSGKDFLQPLGEVFPDGIVQSRPLASDVVVTVCSYEEALKLPIPDDEEGYVLDIMGMEGTVSGHVKLKGAEYLRLHKLVTGLSEKTVWESLVDGTYSQMYSLMPDEFQTWMEEVRDDLQSKYNDVMENILVIHTAIVNTLPEGYTRKEFALKAKESRYVKFLFLAEDGYADKLTKTVWESIKPKVAS